MRLTYKKLNCSFQLEYTKLNSIVVENSDLLMEMLIDLVKQEKKEQETYFLSNNDEKQDINKLVEIITSPMDFVYEKRIVQKKMYEDLMHGMIISGAQDRINEIFVGIIEIIDETSLSADYNLEYVDSFGIMDVLKTFGVTFQEPEGNFVQRFIEYATNVKRFSSKTIFVLSNCDGYLNRGDYVYIEEWAKSYEIFIIFLRNIQLFHEIGYNEYIIDDDLCILH